MTKKVLGWMLVAGMALVACKKEETPAPEPTKTELLSRAWKADSILINDQDASAFFPGFQLTFRTDNVYIALVPPDADSGTWTFANGETQIILDPGPDEEVWTIQTLSSTLLRISSDIDGDTFRAQFSPAP